MRSPCPEQIFLEFSTYFRLDRLFPVSSQNLTQKVDFCVGSISDFSKFITKPSSWISWMSSFVWSWQWCLVFALNNQVLVNSNSARLKNEPLLQSAWTIAVQLPTAMAVLWTDTFACLHGNIANVENLGVWARERTHLSGLSKLAILPLWPSFRISLLSPF